MGQALGKAGVQYGDLTGTVAIDEPDDDARLYELAGLSRDEWFIVAYEIYGSYASTGAYVWAIPREDVGYEEWEEMANKGATTVAAHRFDFEVDDDDAALTLLTLNKRWSIHALFRSFVGLGLDVETVNDE